MTKELKPIEVLKLTLNKMDKEFLAVLPREITVQRFIRTAITAIQVTPSLISADRHSLLKTIMYAAQDGLLLDGHEAVAIPFFDKGKKLVVQYMPMIGGLLKKIYASGEVMKISARTVHENDVYKFEFGDNENIHHIPEIQNDPGEMIAVYAIANAKYGIIFREMMTMREINVIRSLSKTGNLPYSPWTQHLGEMAKKTVLKRLIKRMPNWDKMANGYMEETETEFDENLIVEEKEIIQQIKEPLDNNLQPKVEIYENENQQKDRDENEIPKSEIPRKRGRPRKIRATEETNIENTKLNEPPKRRGRPPKIDKEKETESDSLSFEDKLDELQKRADQEEEECNILRNQIDQKKTDQEQENKDELSKLFDVNKEITSDVYKDEEEAEQSIVQEESKPEFFAANSSEKESGENDETEDDSEYEWTEEELDEDEVEGLKNAREEILKMI